MASSGNRPKSMAKSREPKKEKTVMTPALEREEWNRASDMIVQLNKMGKASKLRVFEGAGVGTEVFTCYLCGKPKYRDKFYVSTDVNARPGVSRICRDCFCELAQPSQNTTDNIDSQREGLRYALEYLDQPFYENVFRSALNTASSSRVSVPVQPFMSYKKTIAMSPFKGRRWKDGEVEFVSVDIAPAEPGEKIMTVDEQEEFIRNKRDVLRVVGYYPFEDLDPFLQPSLYAEFVGYLEGQGDDFPPYWTSSVIQILKNNTQIMQLDKRIDKLMQSPEITSSDSNLLAKLIETKGNLANNNTRLAKENCISLKDSRTTNKGDDSWTGRMKKLGELDLRDYDINCFDIDTCIGMQQVADCSAKAIFKELSFDENEYTDIIKTQRELLQKYQHEAAVSRERARLLLRENLDLKSFMREQGVQFEQHLRNSTLFDQGFFTAEISSVAVNDDVSDSPDVGTRVFDVPFCNVNDEHNDSHDSEDTEILTNSESAVASNG